MRHRFGVERPVRAGISRQQVPQGIDDGRGEGPGNTEGNRYAEGVAQSPGVLDRHPALRTSDAHPQRAVCVGKFGEPGRGRSPSQCLGGGEVADHPQQIGRALDVVRAAVGRQLLELGLELRQHSRVDQFAQIRLTEQLREQGTVQRQYLGPAFGQWRVTGVHERGDIAKQHRTGEGRRRGGLDLHHTHGS